MKSPNQSAAANSLSAVRSRVAGIRERTVRSTAAGAVAEFGRSSNTMRKQMYILKAVGMVIFYWAISPFVTLFFLYPPRETMLVEYFCTVAIGISSVVIRPPHLPKRFMYYCDFFAVLPIVFHQADMYTTNFENLLSCGLNPSADLIIFPIVRIAVLVVLSTFVWEFLYSRTYVEPPQSKMDREPSGGEERR